MFTFWNSFENFRIVHRSRTSQRYFLETIIHIIHHEAWARKKKNPIILCKKYVIWQKISKKKEHITNHSHGVTHHSTTPAQSLLTSEIGRDPVFWLWYERVREFPETYTPFKVQINSNKLEKRKNFSVFFIIYKKDGIPFLLFDIILW